LAFLVAGVALGVVGLAAAAVGGAVLVGVVGGEPELVFPVVTSMGLVSSSVVFPLWAGGVEGVVVVVVVLLLLLLLLFWRSRTA
jgi:hypothetical protein